LHGDREFNLNVEPRQYDEIAESVKVTMKALKDFFGVRASSKQARLRAVGSEFGHMVARNISGSHDPQVVLGEIASFWNDYGLGEMQIGEGAPTTFTLRNCYDCIGTESGDLLCGFKEGFVNAILNDRTGGIGSVEEVECCAMGRENCRFQVITFHHGPESGNLILPMAQR
jgi:predicted hydrocarbon binding protein